jgi:hypothetical protein
METKHRGLIQESWDIYDGEDWTESIDEDDRIERQDLLKAIEFYESTVIIQSE